METDLKCHAHPELGAEPVKPGLYRKVLLAEQSEARSPDSLQGDQRFFGIDFPVISRLL
jgi:hypothetical protein